MRRTTRALTAIALAASCTLASTSGADALSAPVAKYRARVVGGETVIEAGGSATWSMLVPRKTPVLVTLRGQSCSRSTLRARVYVGKRLAAVFTPQTQTAEMWASPGLLSATTVKVVVTGRRQTGCVEKVVVSYLRRVGDPAQVVAPTKPSTQAGKNVFSNGFAIVPPYQLSHAVAGADPSFQARAGSVVNTPIATWVGPWTPNPWQVARDVSTAAGGKTATFVVYAVPRPGCDAAPQVADDNAYFAFIGAFASGLIGPTAVVLEPDALAGNCSSQEALSALQQRMRTAASMLSNVGATVYLDAGHPGWRSVADMAARLKPALPDNAPGVVGFALNVSNFVPTDTVVRYGNELSSLVSGRPFIVDSSRNGGTNKGEVCNPAGAALGETARVGTGALHAVLWLKTPGESDGTCNGGPAAGTFSLALLEQLMRNAGR